MPIDKKQAQFLRDLGIKRSTRSANSKYPGWADHAYRMLCLYVSLNSKKRFLAENARVFAELNGLDEPPSKRAWGGVVAMARANKLIRNVGFAQTSNPTAHRTPATLWEVIS